MFGLDTYNPVPSLWATIEPAVAITLTVAVVMFAVSWLLSRNWSGWTMIAARIVCAAIAVYAATMLFAELGA